MKEPPSHRVLSLVCNGEPFHTGTTFSGPELETLTKEAEECPLGLPAGTQPLGEVPEAPSSRRQPLSMSVLCASLSLSSLRKRPKARGLSQSKCTFQVFVPQLSVHFHSTGSASPHWEGDFAVIQQKIKIRKNKGGKVSLVNQ